MINAALFNISLLNNKEIMAMYKLTIRQTFENHAQFKISLYFEKYCIFCSFNFLQARLHSKIVGQHIHPQKNKFEKIDKNHQCTYIVF